jgi:hypothetical protein
MVNMVPVYVPMTKLNLNPKPAGSIVNMVQVDVQKLLDFIPYSSNLLWYCIYTVFYEP